MFIHLLYVFVIGLEKHQMNSFLLLGRKALPRRRKYGYTPVNKETVMDEKRVIRVRPRAFDTDWRADMEALGVRAPEQVGTLAYTPVNHNPVPFSVEVDLAAMRVTKRIVGVMPNCTYRGHIYSWEEFCELVRAKKGDG